MEHDTHSGDHSGDMACPLKDMRFWAWRVAQGRAVAHKKSVDRILLARPRLRENNQN